MNSAGVILPATSVEDEDILDRTRKKKRGNDEEPQEQANTGVQANRRYSYRESLLGFHDEESSDMEADNYNKTDGGDWNSDSDVGEKAVPNENPVSIAMDKGMPTVKVSPVEKKRLCRPWKNPIIIKVLGRSIGFNVLVRKLNSIWQPKGRFSIIDLGNEFYLVKFFLVDDLSFVMSGGPWMIFDHYLTIRQWHQNFDPLTASIDKVAVWVRFPGLPIEFYDSKFLMHLGNLIGKPLKVDSTTESATRGKYARMCVEVDLSKPLLSRYNLEDKVRTIEYEGIHMVCFECGYFGHRMEDCEVWKAKLTRVVDNSKLREGVQSPNMVEDNLEKADGQGRENDQQMYGPWMIARRQKRGRKSKTGEGAMLAKGKTATVANEGSGSRFQALMTEEATKDGGKDTGADGDAVNAAVGLREIPLTGSQNGQGWTRAKRRGGSESNARTVIENVNTNDMGHSSGSHTLGHRKVLSKNQRIGEPLNNGSREKRPVLDTIVFNNPSFGMSVDEASQEREIVQGTTLPIDVEESEPPDGTSSHSMEEDGLALVDDSYVPDTYQQGGGSAKAANPIMS